MGDLVTIARLVITKSYLWSWLIIYSGATVLNDTMGVEVPVTSHNLRASLRVIYGVYLMKTHSKTLVWGQDGCSCVKLFQQCPWATQCSAYLLWNTSRLRAASWRGQKGRSQFPLNCRVRKNVKIVIKCCNVWTVFPSKKVLKSLPAQPTFRSGLPGDVGVEWHLLDVKRLSNI